MRADLFSFIGVLVLIFVLWVASGGPSRPVSFSGPYLMPITTTGTTAQPYGDPTKFSSINTNVTVGLQGVSASAETSAYSKAVSFSRDLSGVTQTDPENEYVVILVSGTSDTTVSTAGWKIVSKASGAGAPLPQGTEVPRSGRVNPLSPITLRGGDQMIVTTGRSPVGISFKENKCAGYFEENQDFNPSLQTNCPTPSQEFSRFYDNEDDNGSCAAYVRSIPYCATETRASGNISSSCENFVEKHLNYNGCVDTHKGDPDFLGSTWRVFLGSREELWRRDRETITLLDGQNKVIDSITY